MWLDWFPVRGGAGGDFFASFWYVQFVGFGEDDLVRDAGGVEDLEDLEVVLFQAVGSFEEEEDAAESKNC